MGGDHLSADEIFVKAFLYHKGLGYSRDNKLAKKLLKKQVC